MWVERINAGIHGVGALLALAGTVWLLVTAAAQGDPWKITSFAIYGVALVLLFTISSLSHTLPGRAGDIFTRLDHCTIYILIAGTYTPFTLVTLRGTWGWTLLCLIWGLAVAGILLDLLWPQPRRILPVIIYLTMGWLVLVALKPLLLRLDPVGFYLLLAGGITYSVGVPFYGLSRYHPGLHCIWHLLVLGGGVLHYLAVAGYVATS